MVDFLIEVDEDQIRSERQKARELRASAWWLNQKGRGRCYYCHRAVPPAELTMDHKTPIIRGGRTTRHNVVPCCKTCNNEKKYMTLEEWIQLRAEQNNPLPCAADPWT